jgi:hypothetical protein
MEDSSRAGPDTSATRPRQQEDSSKAGRRTKPEVEGYGDAGSGPERKLLRRRRVQRDWWKRRGVLGVRNWEVLVILLVSLLVGVVATVGSSMVGVR